MSQSDTPSPNPSREREGNLTHLDDAGAARMVDVSGKLETQRRAIATGRISMSREAAAAIGAGDVPKGDVLAAARIAGIMAAKRTGELIPLCHPIGLDHVDVDAELDAAEGTVTLTATAGVTARTGVEMEAMTAAAVAALTVYDMVKAVDKSMTITDIYLVEKTGGRSGAYRRPAKPR